MVEVTVKGMGNEMVRGRKGPLKVERRKKKRKEGRIGVHWWI